jgi:hypothetical protein
VHQVAGEEIEKRLEAFGALFGPRKLRGELVEDP